MEDKTNLKSSSDSAVCNEYDFPRCYDRNVAKKVLIFVKLVKKICTLPYIVFAWFS